MQTADNIDIGARIRTAREHLGLTQAALAQQVGVTRSAVAQWETGRAGQVGGHLTQIAAVLGVRIDHLMRGGSARSLTNEFGERPLTGMAQRFGQTEEFHRPVGEPGIENE